MTTDDDPRPHLQCEEGKPPSPQDALWASRCWELILRLLAADERRAA